MTVEDVLRELGVPFKRAGESRHVRDGWCGILCPYCGLGTQNYGMGLKVWGNTLRASCWKCGPKHAVRVLADAADSTPGASASGILPGETGIAPQSPRNAPSSPERRIRLLISALTPFGDPERSQSRLRGSLKPPPGIEPMRPAHRDFVFDKWGLDPDYLADVWGVRGIGQDGDRWSWSLYIPVHDDDGIVVSWVTRKVEVSGTPVHPVRYAAADPDREAVNHKTLLYGSHLAAHAVVVCEGCPDAWAIGPGGSAVFGTGFKPEQVARIARFPVRIVVMDSDSREAIRRGDRLADELMVYPGDTIRVQLTSGKDPSRCSRRELNQLKRLLT